MSRERELLSSIIDMLERSELSGLEYAILDGETVCANDLIDAANKELEKPLPVPVAWITGAALNHWLEKGILDGAHQYTFLAKSGNEHSSDNPRRIAIYAEPTARSYWKEFTYKEALCGIYWVCGNYPEYDIDDSCRTIGAPTGESCKFISLVYIDFNPEDPAAMMVDAIDCHNLGSFSDEYSISHYMEFKIPAHDIKEYK